jgi:hypothetical protein
MCTTTTQTTTSRPACRCGKTLPRNVRLHLCDNCRRARGCGCCGRSLALSRDPSPLCWLCKPARTAAQEAAAERLELNGPTPQAEFLEQYNRVDLALDPFPYSGCTTTCEALWMGVPVVTCPGETFAGRQSLTYLANVGLSDLAATDPRRSVEIAVALAGDLERLAALRAGLRERLARSPLCDGPRFADNPLLRTVWQKRCAAAWKT